MAYSQKFFLQRVREVNEVYLKLHAVGMPNEHIYTQFICSRFHISRSTFYAYLQIPYNRLIADIERREAQNRQLVLFDL